jgi:hypothetical protein
MAESSSSLTTFRALVMLCCVVLIPFAAVCGTSFPAVVKAIQSGRLPTMADFRGPSPATTGNLTDAPPFVPPAISGSNLGATANQSAPPYLGTPRIVGGGSDVIAATYDAPTGPANADSTGQSTTFPQNRGIANNDFSTGTNRGPSAAPAAADRLASFESSGLQSQSDPAAQRSSAINSQLPDDAKTASDAPFKQVQQRLRELGATYYLLETWGDQNDAYRFYCRMAVGGNRHVTKQFNWVASDPLAAMSNVLQQVEDWQKGGGSTPIGLTSMDVLGTH